MSRKYRLSAFAVMGSLLLNGCATKPGEQPGTGEQVANVAGALILLPFQVLAALSGQKIVTPRYWYQALDVYAGVAPYIANQEQFADFMNKYKQPRVLSEQDCLEIIVRLGIPQYAPDWLTPEAKAKTDKFIRDASFKKTGQLLAAPIRLAMADKIDPASGMPIASDAPVQTAQAAAAPVVLDLLFTAAVAAQMTKIIPQMELMIPIGKISDYLKSQIAQHINQQKDDICATGAQCSSVQIPQENVILEQGTGTRFFQPCRPYPAGTIGYTRLDSGHPHYPAGDPHLHLLRVNQDPNGKCHWNPPTPPVADPPPLPSWIDLTKGVPPLTP